MLKSQENCLLLKTNIDKTKAAFIIILSVTKVQKRCVMAEEENQREADEERMIRLSAPAVLDDEALKAVMTEDIASNRPKWRKDTGLTLNGMPPP